MGWNEIATEDAIGRSERAITAMMGTLSNVYNETFAQEITSIVGELDWDGDEMTKLLACVSFVAALAVQELGHRCVEPLEEGEDESPEREAARRGWEMQFVQAFSDTLRDLRQSG